MKIAYCSDLHLEFSTVELKNTGGADVLVLAGDICVAKDLKKYHPDGMNAPSRSHSVHEFFISCCEEFPIVLYVLGNHEHYHGDFATTAKEMKEKLKHLKNLHLLDDEVFEYNGVTFVGGTLWTDMNKEDPLTLYQIGQYMNDFKVVQNSNNVVSFRSICENGSPIFRTRTAKFSPDDSVEAHKKMVALIDKTVKESDNPIVVIGHHTPSFFSCDAMYAGDYLANGAYHTELSEFILDREKIKVWFHGHVHTEFDYMIGQTRISCNPRGYAKYEKIAETFQLKYLEI